MTGIASGVEEYVAYHREALLAELRSMLEAAPRSAFVIELVAECGGGCTSTRPRRCTSSNGCGAHSR